ncbi:hypothetical protein ACVBEH_05615 [Roseateles sp. GG27B]
MEREVLCPAGFSAGLDGPLQQALPYVTAGVDQALAIGPSAPQKARNLLVSGHQNGGINRNAVSTKLKSWSNQLKQGPAQQARQE